MINESGQGIITSYIIITGFFIARTVMESDGNRHLEYYVDDNGNPLVFHDRDKAVASHKDLNHATLYRTYDGQKAYVEVGGFYDNYDFGGVCIVPEPVANALRWLELRLRRDSNTTLPYYSSSIAKESSWNESSCIIHDAGQEEDFSLSIYRKEIKDCTLNIGVVDYGEGVTVIGSYDDDILGTSSMDSVLLKKSFDTISEARSFVKKCMLRIEGIREKKHISSILSGYRSENTPSHGKTITESLLDIHGDSDTDNDKIVYGAIASGKFASGVSEDRIIKEWSVLRSMILMESNILGVISKSEKAPLSGIAHIGGGNTVDVWAYPIAESYCYECWERKSDDFAKDISSSSSGPCVLSGYDESEAFGENWISRWRDHGKESPDAILERVKSGDVSPVPSSEICQYPAGKGASYCLPDFPAQGAYVVIESKGKPSLPEGVFESIRIERGTAINENAKNYPVDVKTEETLSIPTIPAKHIHRVNSEFGQIGIQSRSTVSECGRFMHVDTHLGEGQIVTHIAKEHGFLKNHSKSQDRDLVFNLPECLFVDGHISVVISENSMSVFPVPMRLYDKVLKPRGIDGKKGGCYLDTSSGEDLTGNTYKSASIRVRDENKVLFTVCSEISEPPSKQSGRIVRTNLYKSNSGKWKWDGEKPPAAPKTIISVETGQKHYYAVEVSMENPVTMSSYPEAKREPRLRPTTRGSVTTGHKIGEIITSQKNKHPVYDRIVIR